MNLIDSVHGGCHCVICNPDTIPIIFTDMTFKYIRTLILQMDQMISLQFVLKIFTLNEKEVIHLR
jgi:hypothetical protein